MKVSIYDHDEKDPDRALLLSVGSNKPIKIHMGDRELWLTLEADDDTKYAVEVRHSGEISTKMLNEIADEATELPTPPTPPWERFPYCDKAPRAYVSMPEFCEGCKDTAPCRISNKREIRATAAQAKRTKK